MIGKIIGNYRIVEKLGRGGTGTVFKAIDETLGREVAVKVLNSDLAGTEVLKRFELEIKALGKLNHEEIATIHEIYRTDAAVLMVTEFVRGETLDQVLQRSGMLPPERAAYLVAQILSALAHAHAVGVIHRELKPSNVMITDHGIKLLDFGLARVAVAAQMTVVGFMTATPAYMAPERLQGVEIDARADLYSVGVVFYRLLTNRLPFDAATPTDMVEKLLTAPPTPARTFRPDLPDWCERVLTRALAKSPAERFQTADEFRSALLGSIANTANDTTGTYQVVAPPPPAASGEVSVAGHGPDDDVTIAVATPAPHPVPAGVPVAAASTATVPEALVPSIFLDGVEPTAAVPLGDALATQVPILDGATVLVPGEMAPTVAVPLEAALAPTGWTPTASAPTGTTLTMERRQFAAAGLVLGALVIGVVVLAVIVLRGPAAIQAPETPAPTTQTATAEQPPGSGVTPESAAASTGTPTAPPPPPLEISDPPIRTSPVDAAAARPPALARPAARGATPPAAPIASGMPAREVNTTPFKFDAKAVVADGPKRRERDASILVADGSITVTQKDDSVLYVVAVNGLLGLTYSNSRQPLWNSPNGPVEAMRVESGAFGFLKGGRNWLGFQSADSLLVLRVDDEIVGRVIAGIQERTGLTVARLIEPKE